MNDVAFSLLVVGCVIQILLVLRKLPKRYEWPARWTSTSFLFVSLAIQLVDLFL